MLQFVVNSVVSFLTCILLDFEELGKKVIHCFDRGGVVAVKQGPVCLSFFFQKKVILQFCENTIYYLLEIRDYCSVTITKSTFKTSYLKKTLFFRNHSM